MEKHPSATLKVTGRDGEWQPRYLDVIAGVFVMTYLLANVLSPKICQVGWFTFSAGLLTFPLCCIFGDVLTEIYGFNRTRRIIWLGLFCNLFLAGMVSLAVWLPPADSWMGQGAFAQTFAQVPRIVLASVAAYIVSEFINSYVMSKMKLWSGAKGFGWRAIASTVIAQLADTAIFLLIGFFGVIPGRTLLAMILGMWLAKVAYELVFLPVTTLFVRWLKRLEGVEHFDRQKLELLRF